MAVAGHHARLGTRLRARLCRGLHLRKLKSMSFQGTTLHGSGRAAFPHPALPLGSWALRSSESVPPQPPAATCLDRGWVRAFVAEARLSPHSAWSATFSESSAATP